MPKNKVHLVNTLLLWNQFNIGFFNEKSDEF